MNDTPPTPTNPASWHVGASAGTNPGLRGYHENDPRRPDDVVNVHINRGLRGGKIDLVPLTADEAVELATKLLNAVGTLHARARNRDR